MPLLLVHLPQSIKVAAGSEYSDQKSKSIVEVVSRITGHSVHGLIEKIGSIDRPERMNSTDMHPSTFGMDLYADAVAKVVLEDTLLFPQQMH